MKNNLAVHIRYHLFLHYGWFLQNLGKDFIRTNMHTTVLDTSVISAKKGINYFTLTRSHVAPAIILRIFDVRKNCNLQLWGT